jgi:ABC-type dipeptide/oligopeptide/nickel transport system permease component
LIDMWKYILKRFLLMFPTLIGVAVLAFLLLRIVPGDIVEARLMGAGGAFVAPEMIEAERAKFGLDRPLWRQFGAWLWGLARLDFGQSMWTGAPITEEIKLRFALSMQVALMATVVATVLQNLAQLIWPALAVGYRYSAVATRMTRSAMLEVLREDYIRTARAKGLWMKLILVRHALKNAMLPVVTVIGLEFAFLLGGLVVTEQVFNLNGLGMLFVESVARRDYTLTQALVMLTASAFIVVNFLMDVMYAWLDPRIRYR